MRFSTEQRRARLVARHHLAETAIDAVDAARGLVAVHATDPATVYLSLLARCPGLSIADISRVMYVERRLVRLMAMRRTLFVVPAEHVPVVHHAASVGVASEMRKRLLKRLGSMETDPPMQGDSAAWLVELEQRTLRAAVRTGPSTGAELAAAEPGLRTAYLPAGEKPWDVRRALTSQVLALMGAEGKLVRAQSRGSWTSRAPVWEEASAWWPDGIPSVRQAASALLELYLRRFGPATLTDLRWWTGWTLGATRAALAPLDVIDDDGLLVMADDQEPEPVGEPVANLLPALDATAMGWKERSWYLPEVWGPLYDTNGNIGPTIWWGGEVVGAWAVTGEGSVRTRLLVDRGAEAAALVAQEATLLRGRLEGARVTPSFPTPLERALRTGAA